MQPTPTLREMKSVLPAYSFLRFQVGVKRSRPALAPLYEALPEGPTKQVKPRQVIGYKPALDESLHPEFTTEFHLLGWGETEDAAWRSAKTTKSPPTPLTPGGSP